MQVKLRKPRAALFLLFALLFAGTTSGGILAWAALFSLPLLIWLMFLETRRMRTFNTPWGYIGQMAILLPCIANLVTRMAHPNSRAPFVPLGMAGALALMVFAYWQERAFKKRRAARALEGRCMECGYDLRATPERCPECGTVPPLTRACTICGFGMPPEFSICPSCHGNIAPLKSLPDFSDNERDRALRK